ncbi:MAG: hypothetical protein K0S18_1887, partial [Anaerocolumna sp.]|nr:hypothetical protein [Anaerocolumna sp.]
MNKRTYHKLTLIILCLVLLWPRGLKLDVVQAAAASTGTVTASSLNVRKGPGTNYTVVQVNGSNVFLKKGDTVTIIGEKSGWYNVSFNFSGKSVSGYVLDDYVKVSASSNSST